MRTLVDGKNYLSVMDNFVFTEGVLNITVLSYVWSNTKQKGSDQNNQQLEIIPRKRSVFLFGFRFKLILNWTFFCSKRTKHFWPIHFIFEVFLIGVKFRNCPRILDVYLVFAIWMGQIQSKLIYIFVNYGMANL